MRVKPDLRVVDVRRPQRARQLAVETFRRLATTTSARRLLPPLILNSRREVRAGKLRIGKEHDYSERKVDAAVAAVLAWQARCDALAAGLTARRRTRKLTRY